MLQPVCIARHSPTEVPASLNMLPMKQRRAVAEQVCQAVAEHATTWDTSLTLQS